MTAAALVVAGAWALCALAWRRRAPGLAAWAAIAAVVAAAAAARWSWTQAAAAMLGPATVVGVLAALPRGTLSTRRWLMVAGALVGGVLAVVVGRQFVLGAFIIAGLAGGIVALDRYRRGSEHDRRVLLWFALAAVLVADIALGLRVVGALTNDPVPTAAVVTAATALMPLALVAAARTPIAALLDRALAITLTITSATVVVAALALALVGGLGDQPGSEGDDEHVMLALVTAGLAALVTPRVIARAQPAVNRLIYGRALPPSESLSRFGGRLTRSLPLDELLLQLAELLRDALRLQAAEVWVRTDGHVQLAAGVPHRDASPLPLRPEELAVLARSAVAGESWTEVWLPALHEPDQAIRLAPLVHAGELLGVIVCRRHGLSGNGDAFTPHEDELLAELARQVSLALHNARLDNALQLSLDELQRTNRELRASRARIVAAADDERRKLERDLHDGAQQHLIALALKLRLLEQALPPGSDAGALASEVREDLGAAVGDLRALAHGIFPPLLAAGGLAEAIPTAATRAPIKVLVDVDGVGRYSPDVEAAVYFCCTEALANAAKHAGGQATATITVREEAGSLRFEIADDGAGFEPTAIAGVGHGFLNMVDRLGAMDGSLTVEASPGAGARVCGVIPLGA